MQIYRMDYDGGDDGNGDYFLILETPKGYEAMVLPINDDSELELSIRRVMMRSPQDVTVVCAVCVKRPAYGASGELEFEQSALKWLPSMLTGVPEPIKGF